MKYTKQEVIDKGLVIKAPTQEIWDKIEELFQLKWEGDCNGWRYFEEKTALCPNYNQERRPRYGTYDNGFPDNKYTKISWEDIIIIPEKWCIKGCSELAEYCCEKLPGIGDRTDVYGREVNYYYYLSSLNIYSSGREHWGYTTSKPTDREVITFEFFKQHILKENNMKKVIGYKSPMDLAEGQFPKGTIFYGKGQKGVQNPAYYYPGKEENPITSGAGIPKEIVETWEAVYEEEEVKLSIGIPAREVVIKGTVITSMGRTFTIDNIKEVKKMFDIKGQTRSINYNVSQVNFGCLEEGCTLTITDLDKVLEAYKKVNNE